LKFSTSTAIKLYCVIDLLVFVYSQQAEQADTSIYSVLADSRFWQSTVVVFGYNLSLLLFTLTNFFIMDLLGSIMKSMEKPPTVDTKEKLRQKSKPQLGVYYF